MNVMSYCHAARRIAQAGENEDLTSIVWNADEYSVRLSVKAEVSSTSRRQSAPIPR
jgi:hypothetical protein